MKKIILKGDIVDDGSAINKYRKYLESLPEDKQKKQIANDIKIAFELHKNLKKLGIYYKLKKVINP